MTEANKNDYRVGDDGFWSRAWVAPLVLAIAGGLVAVLTADADRLGYAYLFGLFTATFMLGGIFLVLVQFLTASYWGVSSRRIVEVVMSGAPVVALLALPFIGGVALGKINIYDEWQSVAAHGDHVDAHGTVELGASVAQAQGHAGDHDGDEAAHEEEHSHTPQEAALHHEILSKKTAYLNTNGWAARGIGYLIVWCLIALAYFGWSRRQDDDRDPRHTMRMQRLAAPGLILFACTLTFAAFDWLMSLEAAWFSTIFGVIIFAGSAVPGRRRDQRRALPRPQSAHVWLCLLLDLRPLLAVDVDLVCGDSGGGHLVPQALGGRLAVRGIPPALRTLRRAVHPAHVSCAEARAALAPSDVLLGDPHAHRGHLLVRHAAGWRLPRPTR
ncbi:MAG: hypothetical protein JRJ24_13325 [Deltaproteobacteria bacterium]|nr:hypothetical protein [Deltaproteobacteria bacterium]